MNGPRGSNRPTMIGPGGPTILQHRKIQQKAVTQWQTCMIAMALNDGRHAPTTTLHGGPIKRGAEG